MQSFMGFDDKLVKKFMIKDFVPFDVGQLHFCSFFKNYNFLSFVFLVYPICSSAIIQFFQILRLVKVVCIKSY